VTDRDAVLKMARAFAFVREEPVSSNAGQAVEAFLKHCGLGHGSPWCAAFVSYIMDGALGLTNPLAATASCAALATQAKALGLLKTTPTPGAIFLLDFGTGFHHTGFVLGVVTNASPCTTIEGNTNDDGSREGYGVFVRRRTFNSKARFIHWWGRT
jgi:hypothetical protein